MLRHGIHVEHALRKTAQLHALTLSLRRASKSAARERLLSEFNAFLQRHQTSAQGAQSAPLPSADVLLVGIRACWARGDYATIRGIADVLPGQLLDQSPRLRAYVTAAADQRSPCSPSHAGSGLKRIDTE